MERTSDPVVLVAARVVDGRGSLAAAAAMRRRLEETGARLRRLEIDSLARPWDAPPEPGRESFRSGCGPVMALRRARALLRAGEADAVEIVGEEPLRSGYGRADRIARMAIYPGTTVPEAYTRLAELQMRRLGVDRAGYRALADALIENYRRTARRRGLAVDPARGDRPCTSLFRVADCANPYVDFSGVVLLGNPRLAAELCVTPTVRLAAAAVETVDDGPEALESIVGYAHLGRACARAFQEAEVAFVDEYLAGRALLEAYTCFPPVPLGFLLASGIAPTAADLLGVLARHPITVTGGMNLAGAPWNNPALHAAIVMHEQLAAGAAPIGLVHGNGGTGGYQGVAILGPAHE